MYQPDAGRTVYIYCIKKKYKTTFMYLKHQIPRLAIPGKPALKKTKNNNKKKGIHIYKPGILRGIDETDTWGLPTGVFPSQADSSTYQPCQQGKSH